MKKKKNIYFQQQKMDKKAMLIKILTPIQKERNMATGIIKMLEKDMLKDETIDKLIQFVYDSIQEYYKLHNQDDIKKSLEELKKLIKSNK